MDIKNIYKLRRDVYKNIAPQIKRLTRWTVKDGRTDIESEKIPILTTGAYKQLLVSGLTDDISSLHGTLRDVTKAFQDEVRNINKIPHSRGI